MLSLVLVRRRPGSAALQALQATYGQSPPPSWLTGGLPTAAGTLLFFISYEIVSWDVATIRHTLAEMNGAETCPHAHSVNFLTRGYLGTPPCLTALLCSDGSAGERVPYWDTTAKVMWGFGISLALFAFGNFLILLPELAFLIAGCVAFLVGFIVITGMTFWQAQFQWDEHVKEYLSGKTGANLGMAGQVLDGGVSDVEGLYMDDEEAGLQTPLLPGSASGRWGDRFGAAGRGQSPSFSGRGGPVSVDPGLGTAGRDIGRSRGDGRGAPLPGQARMVMGEGMGCLPKRGSRGRGQTAGDEDPGAFQAGERQGRKKNGIGCWTERL